VNDKTLPVPVDPLDRAILDLLCKLPLLWGTIDSDALTATELEALRLMTRAGLVEERIRFWGRMDGFPQIVEMQFCVCGQCPRSDLVRQLLQTVPGWLDANGRTRGRFKLEQDGVVGVRLTTLGEQTRDGYDSSSPDSRSSVLALVRGTGPMGVSSTAVGGRVYVEYCRVETVQEGDSQKQGAVLAAAQATASVGDITVHNQIVVDPGALADMVAERLSEQPAARKGGKSPGGSATPAAEKAAKKQPWVDDAPEYLPLTAAAKLIDNRLSLPVLSKLLSPRGKIRYMRKGHRSKVHVADFRRYMQGQQSDPEWAKNLAVYYTAAGKGDMRFFWHCPQCGADRPENSSAKIDCPKCKVECKLIRKAPPKPRR
jgi:hypothetical protein